MSPICPGKSSSMQMISSEHQMPHTNLRLHAALKDKVKVKFELQTHLTIQFVPHSKHITA
jgi:hypothetical protein